MSRILKNYLKRLTNISTRNKSIVLPKLTHEHFFDIHDLDFVLSTPSFEIINQVVQRRKRIPLADVADPRYEKVNALSQRLRKIARTAAFLEEEQGTTDLFIGYPFVRGKFLNDTVVHAPLLFFPVTLTIEKNQWCLTCRNDVGVVLNRAFALAYAQFNETTVPDEILETSFEDFPLNTTLFKSDLYKWLKESPFEINFNQDIFDDKLIYFDGQKAKDLELLEKRGELKLFPEAVLGIFPQAGSYLEPDYHFLIQHNINPLLQFNKGANKNDSKEENLLAPFPMDASQESVIQTIKHGKSIVIQGPPGTGKSQVIANLMADYAAHGKRTLLVCQKKAALDVVHNRLVEIGLGNFTALIHDHKTDRANLYQQLALQITQADSYKATNNGFNAVLLERQFYQASRQIDLLVKELDSFKNALFDTSLAGISVKELYLTSSPDTQVIPLSDLLNTLKVSDVELLKPRFLNYFEYWIQIAPQHSWHNRKNFSNLNQGHFRILRDLLLEWPLFYTKQCDLFGELTQNEFHAYHFHLLEELLIEIQQLKEVLPDQETYQLFNKFLSNTSRLEAVVNELQETLQLLHGMGPVEQTLSTHELQDALQQLDKVLAAKENTFSRLLWNLFGKEYEYFRTLTQKNQLTTSTEDLQLLRTRIKNRIDLEKAISSFEPYLSTAFLPSHLSYKERYDYFFEKAFALAKVTFLLYQSEWSRVILPHAQATPNRNHFLQYLQNVSYWVDSWGNYIVPIQQYLTPEQLEQLLLAPQPNAQRLVQDLQQDFENLVELDRFHESFNETELILVSRLETLGVSMGLKQAKEFVQLLDNSIRIAWINYIEDTHPILRAVSSLKMEQLERELQERILEKETLSTEIVKMKLREAVYQGLQVNRLGNTVSYRELFHQVTKKRRIWPIRKVLDHHKDEVFQLMPCWMASPESVSVLFPMVEGLFDLVIFDEASQCYAEYALPAAYRGKQLVVAGDSKQLQPTDLYQIRYEEIPADEEDTIIALEVESLLDLAHQQFDVVSLTGHYRSLSLDLIQFSNQHFYQNKLQLLPDFRYINQLEPGIVYDKVDGVWKNNTNWVEAKRVVEIIQALQHTNQSIGVITFNYPQQALIQELLEQAELEIPHLFIKNIENVQGDERDVIIFSVGYAPDTQGRLLMHFGSLNNKGGENRLNVAVTRAKSRIYFVTSLLPNQIQTEGSAHAGPKLLRAYFDYALQVSNGQFKPRLLDKPLHFKGGLLKDVLLQNAVTGVEELPFADITLKEDNRYTGVILTDDDHYLNASTSKEPHAYLPIKLTRKGWPYKRVYSREAWLAKHPVI